MNKIDKLLGIGEKVKFKVGKEEVEFNILPLKNKELLEIISLETKDDMENAILKKIFYSLHRDDPTVTIEQVKEMPFLLDSTVFCISNIRLSMYLNPCNDM